MLAISAFRSTDRRLDDLLAAERQQLARQRRGALAGALHVGQRPVDRDRPGSHVVQHRLGVAEDDRQQVVEVVRHAAGQPADRLHLLRLPQLLLEAGAAARGRGRARGCRASRPPGRCGSPVVRDGIMNTLMSTGTPAPVARSRTAPSPLHEPAARNGGRTFASMNGRADGWAMSKIGHALEGMVLAEAQEAAARLVQVEQPDVQRREPDQLVAVLDQRAERLVLLLRLPQRRDVEEDRRETVLADRGHRDGEVLVEGREVGVEADRRPGQERARELPR